MLRDYELMLVLDPSLDEAASEAVTKRIGTTIGQRKGKVLKTEAWGRRRLAYPIGRHRDGVYVLIRFQIPGDHAAEIERALKLTESIIRYLVSRVEPSAPAAARE